MGSLQKGIGGADLLPGEPGFGCGDGAADVGFGVGGGDKARFKGGGGKVVAGIEHGVEETVEGFLVAGHDGFKAVGAFFGKVEAEHAAYVLGAEFDAVLFRRCGEAFAELLGAGGEVLVEAGGLDVFQGGETGGNGYRVAGQGACLIDGAEGGDFFHDVASAAKGRQGHAAADDFAEGGEVRGDAEQALGRAGADPEAGHHFIKYQDAAVLGGEVAQLFEEFRGWNDQVHVAGHGFQDHGGDFVAVLGKGFGQGLGVVVGQDQGVARQVFRDAAGGGVAEGE